MKSISIVLIMIFLSGCITFKDAGKSAFDAGSNEEKSEEARKNGDEALARIYEHKARDDNKRADTSFINLLLGTIFEGAITEITED